MNYFSIAKKYNQISIIVFILINIVAHLFVPNSYDWKNNTISELAAQSYNNKWIMKIGFILFGAILSFGIFIKLINRKGNLIKEIPIMIYGIIQRILYSGKFCLVNVFL